MKKAFVLFAIISLIAFFAAGVMAATEAKIVAPGAEASDNFGKSVSISGDYAIVGAHGEETGGSMAGAAYIYHRTGLDNVWDAGTEIKAFDAQASDVFGWSVSISGDYAIVGAYGEDEEGSLAGAAYIFHRTGPDNVWDAGIKIVAADAAADDWFGVSVSISGDYAIVGAHWEDPGASDAGAAYIYHRTGPDNVWDTGTKIMASDVQAYDYFGISVSISGDYAIVGAYGEDTGGSNAGAAYIYHRTGPDNVWDTGTKIMASDAQGSDWFGVSVSISGPYAIVGAYQEDEGGSNAGAAYVYQRTGENAWDTETKIMASDAEADDQFGKSVSISGPYAIVGAQYEDTGASGAGAAYLYFRTGENTWDTTETKMQASDFEAGAYFGSSVSIYGYYAIVGAVLDDPGSKEDAGSAYIYDHDLPAAIDLLFFEAQWADQGAILSWMTGTELDCGAFMILRCEGGIQACEFDDFKQLADIVIPCEDSAFGAEYEAFDLTADQSADYSYMLCEYETTGGVNHYGPVFLSADPSADSGQANDDDNFQDDDDVDVSDDDNADTNDFDGGDAADGDEDTGGCGF